jgi:hypothetical protein
MILRTRCHHDHPHAAPPHAAPSRAAALCCRESPVLGAWGLGWEVWLDGMEVTQFTYFQQAGGRVLEAPAVEITYGLERILMSLQGVANFKDIK